MRFRKDLGVALAQLLQYLAEFHGVGPVAGVGFVKQGDMIIAADQQPQTDLSQIDAASLVLAAPGEPGRGTSVDVGEEVGGVVDQGGGVDAPIAHQHLRDFLLDGLDGFERKFSHVVEKALAAQLRGIGGEQSIENGPRVPVGQLRLGCGSQAAVENGQQGVLPYGESLVSFGDVAVDDLGELELLGHRIKGSGSSKLEREALGGHRGGGLLEQFADVLSLAEVELFDVAGAAVHPSGLDQVIVAVAADGLGDDGRHC